MIPSNPFYAGLLGGALFCVVLGVAGGLFTQLGPWYDNLQKPSWKPPDWAFGPVWTTIFVLLSLALAYAWQSADASMKTALLVALLVNGILNIAWSAIFFTMRNPTLALYELVAFWLSIVALLFVMSKISTTSLLLGLPYLIWVTIAGVLNYNIVQLNRT
jgi:benzodiazapine receptor